MDRWIGRWIDGQVGEMDRRMLVVSRTLETPESLWVSRYHASGV